jgi:hypothetical protein
MKARLNAGCNALIAVAAGLTIIAPRLPWFLARLAPDLSDEVNAPDGPTWAVPFPWEGAPYQLDGCTLFMTWSYGGLAACTAALTSLIAAIVSPAPLEKPVQVRADQVQEGTLPSA